MSSNLPTAKELKKLAAACRAAGIYSFKCGDLEFTLGDKPVKQNNKKAIQRTGEVQDPIDAAFEQDALTQDELLLWSALPADGSGEQPQ